MPIVPPSKPNISRIEVERILEAKGCPSPALLFIRGYYQDSMGARGTNDRGLYDDCAVIVYSNAPPGQQVFRTYNANTDPSIFKPGVATLNPGMWMYKKGRHKLFDPFGYAAFRQAEEVEVTRDGWTRTQRGLFGINVHKGGYNTTSSLGCLTIYPEQWANFKSTGYTVMDRAQQATIPLLLITEAERRAIRDLPR